MACRNNDAVRFVPAVRFVIHVATVAKPVVQAYYGGPLVGMVGAWQVAWHFPRREDAEAMVKVLGCGTVMGVFYDGSDCWLGLV